MDTKYFINYKQLPKSKAVLSSQLLKKQVLIQETRESTDPERLPDVNDWRSWMLRVWRQQHTRALAYDSLETKALQKKRR